MLLTKRLPKRPNYLAPDGTEIGLLPAMKGGGLCECVLPVGGISKPVKHKKVEEIWYVLEGEGQVWRKSKTKEKVVKVKPGVALTIPPGVSFQFRNTGKGPLRMMIVTMPPWPGPEEAIAVDGKWKYKMEHIPRSK